MYIMNCLRGKVGPMAVVAEVVVSAIEHIGIYAIISSNIWWSHYTNDVSKLAMNFDHIYYPPRNYITHSTINLLLSPIVS